MAHSFQCLYLVGFEWVEPCILLFSTSQSEEDLQFASEILITFALKSGKSRSHTTSDMKEDQKSLESYFISG
jgi:hypothetical protein